MIESASATVLLLIALGAMNVCAGQTPTSLKPARPLQCSEAMTSCQDYDAVVFVHGIYGSDDTFKNQSTEFDWPVQFPACIKVGADCRHVDVFRLDYRTALLSWAKGDSPSFMEIAKGTFAVMKPLRQRQYRSIGFIAHSLGGNVVSTYLVMVNLGLGHPQLSQNAFVITLATPVLGSQVADIADALKKQLGMQDPLLDSLKNNNLYLGMLNDFRSLQGPKKEAYGCRHVDLYAAYEQKYLGPLLIVTPDSAALSISQTVSSPVVGFPLDHVQIAKPADTNAPVYQWAMGLVHNEYIRMAAWSETHKNLPSEYQLCERMRFLPEQ